MYDDDGNCLFQNTETNGRFHSDWCSMIYPRLKLARNLLTDDGVIFISIDDNEVAQLRKICDEVFGEGNFVACVVWERAYSPINLKKHFSENHDFVICYAKRIDSITCNGLQRSKESVDRYTNPDNDPRGAWQSDNLSVGPVIQDKVYEIITPSGRSVYPPDGRCWVYTKERLKEMIDDNRIWFGSDGNNVPRVKRFMSEVKTTVTPMTIWKYTEVGHSQDAAQKLKMLFDGHDYFDYPKSVDLIKRMLELYTNHSPDIILDFFSGSATTAHAVMQLNAEDGGNRKFIMVQLPEVCDEKSEAAKAGYKNICEIGKERIRRAGEKIKSEIEAANAQIKLDEEPKKVPDIGFRVLKVDSTNMNDVYYAANEYKQEQLDQFVDNIKEDRTDLDLLYGVLLDWGVQLSSKHEIMDIDGIKVHNYDDLSLVACLEKDKLIPESVIRKIAKMQPLRVVFRDSSFASSPEKINVEEIFKINAPGTSVRVL